LNEWLDGRYISFEIGHHKSDPKFFKYVLENLQLEPKEIVFFDDSESKVESARKIGIDAQLYTGYQAFSQQLQELGI
jgi:putative hydrolase of the HAD superfamily